MNYDILVLIFRGRQFYFELRTKNKYYQNHIQLDISQRVQYKTRRQEDKKTRRQEDKKTRRQEDKKTITGKNNQQSQK